MWAQTAEQEGSESSRSLLLRFLWEIPLTSCPSDSTHWDPFHVQTKNKVITAGYTPMSGKPNFQAVENFKSSVERTDTRQTDRQTRSAESKRSLRQAERKRYIKSYSHFQNQGKNLAPAQDLCMSKL